MLSIDTFTTFKKIFASSFRSGHFLQLAQFHTLIIVKHYFRLFASS